MYYTHYEFDDLQACVDVSRHTLVGIRLFDWDRTGDHDALGRLATHEFN